jgi:hypothetical protein
LTIAAHSEVTQQGRSGDSHRKSTMIKHAIANHQSKDSPVRPQTAMHTAAGTTYG